MCDVGVVCVPGLCTVLLSIPAPPTGISVCGGFSVLWGGVGLVCLWCVGHGSAGIGRATMMLRWWGSDDDGGGVGGSGGDGYVMHGKVGSISLGRWEKAHSSAAWSISVH